MDEGGDVRTAGARVARNHGPPLSGQRVAEVVAWLLRPAAGLSRAQRVRELGRSRGSAARGGLAVDVVTRIADAVLYEGYILWPYRKSALKNQRRFGFGTVYPPGGPERSFNQTACLLKGDEKATVEVTVRFLHKVDRQIWRGGEPIDEVEIGGELHQSWEEVVERELRLLVDMRSPARLPFEIAAGASREELGGGCVVVRGWHTLRGSVVASAQLVRPGLFGLRVRTENVTPGDPDDRERSGLRSAHT